MVAGSPCLELVRFSITEEQLAKWLGTVKGGDNMRIGLFRRNTEHNGKNMYFDSTDAIFSLRLPVDLMISSVGYQGSIRA